MIVLHGAWLEDTFYLWAEHHRPLPPRRGRRAVARVDRARPHPYAAEEDALEWALQQVIGQVEVDGEASVLTLALPSDHYTPAPSTELGRSPLGEVSPEQLALWSVPALAYAPLEALSLLVAVPVRVIGPRPGLLLGGDLRYWSYVAAFALELLAGQRFVPALVERGHDLEARWRAWLEDPQDLERLACLVQVMPAVCRAARPPRGAWTPPSARELLTQVLHTLVDQAARAWAPSPQVSYPYSQTPSYRWMQSLTCPEAVMPLRGEERSLFRQQARTWLEGLRQAGLGDVRLCLRLDPPNNGDADLAAPDPDVRNWTLRYFLQARDDPSLLVPAAQVWRTRGRTLRILNRYIRSPQEALLRGLGMAARLFPPIEQSLQEAQPTGCALTAWEAYTFLKEAAPLLEQSGFGVLLPAWWARRDRRLGLKVAMRPAPLAEGSGLLGMENLVQFDWQLALGQHTLSPEEFRTLAALKVPFVQIRGEWVEVDPEQIERALRFWEAHPDQETLALPEALRLALDPASGAPVDGLEVVDVQVEGPLADLLNKLESARMEVLPQPRGFRGQLRPYQLRGFSWMAFLRRWGLGACLADDMGLGKTPQTIALFLHEREQGITDRPALVVCPTSVVVNWKREIERFAPSLRAVIHHGPARERDGEFVQQALKHDVVITSYALLHRDIEFLVRVSWSDVVLDEAQNIKNPHTKTAQAARRLPADFRIALTGTPVENRLLELWSIFTFLNRGYLGSQRAFRERFIVPVERFGDETSTRRLRRLTGPFILRRLKTDREIIKDLPEKLEMKVYVSLTQEQATLYQAVVDSALGAIEESSGIQRRGLVLSTLMKLKQICNHPAQFLGESPEVTRLEGRSGKLRRLVEMLEEVLEEGDKALVFTQFTQMGDLLRRYLEGALEVEVLYLHGGVRQKDRQRLIDAFQSPCGPPVFLLSIRAGGTGLNLTAATHVFHYDRWWNPAVEDQATDRTYRIGQRRNVQVRKFVTQGTVEERIDELIEQKKDLAARVVSTGEEWLTELSTEELRELFTLRTEVVV